jgi:hypothetical protein
MPAPTVTKTINMQLDADGNVFVETWADADASSRWLYNSFDLTVSNGTATLSPPEVITEQPVLFLPLFDNRKNHSIRYTVHAPGGTGFEAIGALMVGESMYRCMLTKDDGSSYGYNGQPLPRDIEITSGSGGGTLPANTVIDEEYLPEGDTPSLRIRKNGGAWTVHTGSAALGSWYADDIAGVVNPTPNLLPMRMPLPVTREWVTWSGTIYLGAVSVKGMPVWGFTGHLGIGDYSRDGIQRDAGAVVFVSEEIRSYIAQGGITAVPRPAFWKSTYDYMPGWFYAHAGTYWRCLEWGNTGIAPGTNATYWVEDTDYSAFYQGYLLQMTWNDDFGGQTTGAFGMTTPNIAVQPGFKYGHLRFQYRVKAGTSDYITIQAYRAGTEDLISSTIVADAVSLAGDGFHIEGTYQIDLSTVAGGDDVYLRVDGYSTGVDVYDNARTYATNEVMVTTANNFYISLQNGNVGHAIGSSGWALWWKLIPSYEVWARHTTMLNGIWIDFVEDVTIAPETLRSVPSGSYSGAQTVRLQSTRPGTIYYKKTGETEWATATNRVDVAIAASTTLTAYSVPTNGGPTEAETSTIYEITGPDTATPTVTAFVVPATSTPLTVPITSLTATDDVGVTGYLLTESSTPPQAGAAGWSATAPTEYTFATEGAKTLYAWAKDAAGNVSAGVSAGVTVSAAAGTFAIADATSGSYSDNLTLSLAAATWAIKNGADTRTLKTASGTPLTLRRNVAGTWQ